MSSADTTPEKMIAPKNSSQELPDDFKTTLLQNYMSGSIILGTAVFFINLFIALQQKDLVLGALTAILFLVLFIITFTKSIRFSIRSILLSILYISAGVISIISTGINANAVLYFFISILLLGVLVSGPWWIVGLIFEGVMISVIGLFNQLGIIKLNSFFSSSNSLLNWFTTITITLFIAFVIVAPLVQFLRKLQNQKNEIEKRTTEFIDTNSALSRKVDTLESESDKQRSKLIAVRQITRDITQQTNLQKMLTDATNQICNQFGFTYAAIFLADDRNEFADLVAGSGQVGKQMVEQGHKLRIREEGIVGYVVARGETRLALDVGVDSMHKLNPLLPDTRSEIGIPLKTANNVLGALDIQSDKDSAFSQDDVELLQSLADQLSVMVAKTRQITSLESQINDLQASIGESVRGVWHSHLQGSRKNLSYKFSDNRLSDANSVPLLESNNSTNQSYTIETVEDESILTVPIKLRDQVLGVIQLKYKGKKVPPRLVNLVNTATDRLSVAIENARLLETIQERAEREHKVGEISSKVRSAQTVESILQTAVTELGKSLGINEVSIQLKTTANTEQE
jgi:GAF domain-containing protein